MAFLLNDIEETNPINKKDSLDERRVDLGMLIEEEFEGKVPCDCQVHQIMCNLAIEYLLSDAIESEKDAVEYTKALMGMSSENPLYTKTRMQDKFT